MSEAAAVARADRRTVVRLSQRDLVVLWPRAEAVIDPRTPPRRIFLSPHFDDAPLCAGGRMLAGPPGVWRTVVFFSRSAFWRFRVERDEAFIALLRLAEERHAARLFGYALETAGLAEAPLRGRPDPLNPAEKPDSRDREVIEAVRRLLASLAARFPDARFAVPMGIGHHIDHRILRDAALAVLPSCGVGRDRIELCEDLPYAATARRRVWPPTVLPGARLKPRVEAVRADWKAEGLRAYFSQLHAEQIAAVEQYARSLGGGFGAERFWLAGSA